MDEVGGNLLKARWPAVTQKHLWERDMSNPVKEKRRTLTPGQWRAWVTSGKLLGSIFAQHCQVPFRHEEKGRKWLSLLLLRWRSHPWTSFLGHPQYSLYFLPPHTLSSLPYWGSSSAHPQIKLLDLRVLFSSCSYNIPLLNDTIHFIILNSYYKTPKTQSLAENLIITLDEQMQ